MDLASLDATMDHAAGQHYVMAREQHGGAKVPLTDQQYHDLITVQLADWLEQVGLVSSHVQSRYKLQQQQAVTHLHLSVFLSKSAHISASKWFKL